MRKAADQGLEPGPILAGTPEEQALIRRLDGFEAALARACELRAPNHLCDHAFSLAQAFSAFYAACPILPEENEAVRASRLALAETVLKQLELNLALIGLEAPEKM